MIFVSKISFFVILFALMKNSIAASGYDLVAEKTLFNGEKLYEYKLKNDMHVILVPRHQAKVLTYQLWFQVGSNDEKLDPKLKKTGLAHLFEHMMFRGTEKYPDGKFDELTARLGGDKQNASTYFYRTNYYVSVPSHQLESLMEMESDRMRNLKLTAEVIEKEKGAVVGELRRFHIDSPGAIAFEELMKLVYETSPFRYTVIGTEAEIKGFTLDEAQYFYKTFYAPNNANLIVVGDIDGNQLMELVVKYYGAMAPQNVPKRTLPEEPSQKKERRFERAHSQATSEILLVGYRIPPIQASDTIPLSLMGAHLSSGMEGRLRKLLVDTGIAVGASAATSNQPDLFEFSVHLAEKHKAEEALKIIDKEIAFLQSTKIDKKEFQRALNQELLELYGEIGDNSALANIFGESLMVSGSYLRGLEIAEGYKHINTADLQRVAKKYFRKENRSIVIVRPEKKKGKS